MREAPRRRSTPARRHTSRPRLSVTVDSSAPTQLGAPLPRWVTVLVVLVVLGLVAAYVRATHGSWYRIVPFSIVPLALATAEGVLSLRARRRGRREPRWLRVLLVTPLAALGGLASSWIDPSFASPGAAAGTGAIVGLLYGLQGVFGPRRAGPAA